MKTLKIFGPPGTGKTHRMLTEMERELVDVAPERLAYLTFTVAARREARGRALEKFGFTAERLPYFRTLHSTAWRAMNLPKSALITEAAQLRAFGESVGLAFTVKGRISEDDGLQLMGGGVEKGDKFMAFDHFRRHNMLGFEEGYKAWTEPLPYHEVKRFTAAYQEWKRREMLLDFTDLLESDALPALPVDVVIVDEAQDLSLLQWKAMERFAATAQRLYVAGDDDQAIYEWAGAAPSAFIDLPGEEQVLGQSRRVPRRVQALAERIARGIKGRRQKTYLPRDVEGEVRMVGHVEAWEPRDGTSLALFRNHYLAKRVEEHLRHLGVPYSKHDRPAPGSEWGAAIYAWERWRKGEQPATRDLDEIRKATSHARFGHLDMAMPWYDALDRVPREEVQYLRAVVKRYGGRALLETPKVRLSTIHGAKGAEADHVVLLGDMSRKASDALTGRGADAERRVWYVAVTRARETLTIVGAQNRLLN